MHARWRTGRLTEEIVLVRASSGASLPGTLRVPPEIAAARLEEWFPDSALSRMILSEICDEIHGPLVRSPTSSLSSLRRKVGEALRDGRLLAHQRRIEVAPGTAPSEPVTPPAPSSPPKVEEKTWIEIEVVDNGTSPQPITGLRYRIELPDSSIREGRLDARGKARVEGIDPGNCAVTFPELDQDAWASI